MPASFSRAKWHALQSELGKFKEKYDKKDIAEKI
jgi:hypothetical protein